MQIYLPCALGGILNDDTIQLKVKAVCSANNQLKMKMHSKMLEDKGYFICARLYC